MLRSSELFKVREILSIMSWLGSPTPLDRHPEALDGWGPVRYRMRFKG